MTSKERNMYKEKQMEARDYAETNIGKMLFELDEQFKVRMANAATLFRGFKTFHSSK